MKQHIRRSRWVLGADNVLGPWLWGLFMSKNSRKPVCTSHTIRGLQHCRHARRQK